MSAPSVSSSRYGEQPPIRRSGNLTGAAVTVALHVAVIALLLQFESVRKVLVDAKPLMVSLITPVAPKPDVLPKPLPVQPKVQPKPTQPQPLAQLTVPTEAPATLSVPPQPPPSPPPPVEKVVVAQAVVPQAPPAPPAPPAPVVPPNFNADYLRNPPPAYPSLSKRQGHQGRVIFRILVNAAGAPDQVLLYASSGHDLLDNAAMAAVRRWRFVPARQGDQPLAAWVLVPVNFTLEG